LEDVLPVCFPEGLLQHGHSINPDYTTGLLANLLEAKLALSSYITFQFISLFVYSIEDLAHLFDLGTRQFYTPVTCFCLALDLGVTATKNISKLSLLFIVHYMLRT
jgi:hypothetical protein